MPGARAQSFRPNYSWHFRHIALPIGDNSVLNVRRFNTPA